MTVPVEDILGLVSVTVVRLEIESEMRIKRLRFMPFKEGRNCVFGGVCVCVGGGGGGGGSLMVGVNSKK